MVVDTIPVELKRSYMVWSWFVYVLAANLLLVIPPAVGRRLVEPAAH
ncbi:sensor protein PhoQ [Klebsiella pneumoniae subsp. rhinoscleromatis]|nr:sensor protein PhoQ [Klebsiella pneumoniae subsp. rhinoscleromatis]